MPIIQSRYVVSGRWILCCVGLGLASGLLLLAPETRAESFDGTYTGTGSYERGTRTVTPAGDVILRGKGRGQLLGGDRTCQINLTRSPTKP